MDNGQHASLDAQVQEAMQALEAVGEPITTEGVRRRVGRRMSDVLHSLRRLTRGTPEPDTDTRPEAYPEVVEAAHRVARLTAAIQAAERTLADRGTALAQAHAAAVEALIDGRDAPSLVDVRQAVLQAAELLHLLELATGTAKERYAAALTEAQARHWQALWRAHQMNLAVFDSALAEAFEAQQAVLSSWNTCGQPGDAPVLRGPLSIWASDFHTYLQDLVATAPEAVQRGAVLTSGGQSRAY